MARVLIVDDSAFMLEMMASILEQAGHQVLTSSSARKALQLLREQAADLLVTDVFMPDMDGLELLREARRIRVGIPVVAVSGITGKRSMLRAAEFLGACSTLQKPFSKADLIEAVAKALNRQCFVRPKSEPAGAPREHPEEYCRACSRCPVETGPQRSGLP